MVCKFVDLHIRFTFWFFFHLSFDGRVVAKLPFVPLSYIQGLSHRNLLGEDYTDCSFIFLYILCTMSIRQVMLDTLATGSKRKVKRKLFTSFSYCSYVNYNLWESLSVETAHFTIKVIINTITCACSVFIISVVVKTILPVSFRTSRRCWVWLHLVQQPNKLEGFWDPLHKLPSSHKLIRQYTISLFWL